MISGRVEMPTMKEEGTSTRMFWEERAPWRGTVNVDGVQVQVAVGLEDRKHEGGAAVVAFGGLARAHLAEDDEDFVRRAHAVAAEQPGGRQDDEENQNGDRNDLVHGIGWGVWLGLLVNEEV